MKNQSNGHSNFDNQLKKLNNDIRWSEKQKNKLEYDILNSISRGEKRNSMVSRIKYSLSIGVMILILGFGYLLFSDNMTEEEQLPPDKTDTPVVADQGEQDDQEEQEENQEQEETQEAMEVHIGSTETVIRNVEGMDSEVEIVHYTIEPYGINFQLDSQFEGAEMIDDQVTFAYLEEYQIHFEVIEDMTLADAVTNLQVKIEAEGYDESFELEDTPLEENNLIGKMQFFASPVKGFIAYEIAEDVMVITFEYPEVGGDGMYHLLLDLRKSIEVR